MGTTRAVVVRGEGSMDSPRRAREEYNEKGTGKVEDLWGHFNTRS